MGDLARKKRRRSPAVGLLAMGMLLLLSASAVRVAESVYIDAPPHAARLVQGAFFAAPVIGLLLIAWVCTGCPRVPSFLCFSGRRNVVAIWAGAVVLVLSAAYWLYSLPGAAFLGLWWDLP